MAHPLRAHGAPQFHRISAGQTPAYGRNGDLLGSLIATLVHVASGETQYALLAVRNDPRSRSLVPVPWAILDRFQRGQACVADVDRRKLVGAPHCTEAELDRFGIDLACLIDGTYGLEFPGIESLNDLA